MRCVLGAREYKHVCAATRHSNMPAEEQYYHDYTFPFNTCEAVSSGIIAQPVSFTLNAVTCVALCVIAARTRRLASAVAVASYALFEGFHAYSHAHHVAGHVQMDIVHCIGYMMSISALFAIRTTANNTTHHYNTTSWRLMIVAAFVLLDLVATLTLHHTLVMVATGLAILASVFITHRDNLPQASKTALLVELIPGMFALLALFVNEALHCTAAMRFNAAIPYHAAIELLGGYMFIRFACITSDL
jgi:hypothetical protein